MSLPHLPTQHSGSITRSGKRLLTPAKLRSPRGRKSTGHSNFKTLGRVHCAPLSVMHNENESSDTPLTPETYSQAELDHIINIKGAVRIQKRTTEFTITTLNCTIDFQCSSPELFEKWLRCFSKATGIIPIALHKQKNTESTKQISKLMKNHDMKMNLEVTPSARYYSSDLEFDEEQKVDFFSSFARFDNNTILIEGTISDIIRFCILNSIQRNEDCAALFATYSILESSTPLYMAISKTWKVWRNESSSLPDFQPTILNRLANFSYHYIESPITQKYSKDIRRRKKVQKSAIKNAPSFTEYIQSARFPQAPTLYNYDVKSFAVIFEDAMKYSPSEVAVALSLFDSKLFDQVSIGELLKYDHAQAEAVETPALQFLLNSHEKISRWVTWNILDAGTSKEQAQMFVKYDKLVHRLHEMQSYRSCASIIKGMFSGTIQRLQQLQEEIPSKNINRLHILRELYLDSRKYRTLATVPVCLPLLDVYLTDIMSIKHSMPTYVDAEKGIINFQKMRKLSSVLLELHHTDSSRFFIDGLEVNDQLFRCIIHIDAPSHESLMEKSLFFQPHYPNSDVLARKQVLLEEKAKLLAIKNDAKVSDRANLIGQQKLLWQLVQADNGSVTVKHAISVTTQNRTDEEAAEIYLNHLRSALDLLSHLSKAPEPNQ